MKVLKNFIYQMTYEVLVVLLPVITTPYVSRILQPDGVGKYSLAVTIANYFVLIGLLGTNNYGRRQIAYVRDDEILLRKSFWEIFILRCITVGFALISYLAFVHFGVQPENKTIYLIESLTIASNLVDITWFFIGIESFKKTATRSIIFKLLGVILIFLLVKEKSDIWLYTMIMSGTTFLSQLFLWTQIPRKLLNFEIEWGSFKIHLRKTVHLWLPSIAINIYSSLDKVMLGCMASEYEVGLYEQSQKIVKIASTITTSLSTVLLPRVANLFKHQRKEEFKHFAGKALSVVSCIAVPICFGIIGIRDTLIPWFYGPGYEKIASLLLVSSWLVISLSWSSIFGPQVLVASGQENKYTIAVSIVAVVNLILNVFLIKRFQSLGALISSVVAEYTGTFIMFLFVKEYFEIKPIIKYMAKYIMIGIIMSIAVYYEGIILGSTIRSTIIQIVSGGFVYAVALLLMKDENLLYGISIIKEKLKSNIS